MRKLIEEMIGGVPGTRIVEQSDGSIMITSDYVGQGGIEPRNFPRWAVVEFAKVTVRLRDTGQNEN